MQKINFDFYKFVDISFKTCIGHFVPLSTALDIMMTYLSEGVKIMLRFTYAIMKHHKAAIKQCKNPDELVEAFTK